MFKKINNFSGKTCFHLKNRSMNHHKEYLHTYGIINKSKVFENMVLKFKVAIGLKIPTF